MELIFVKIIINLIPVFFFFERSKPENSKGDVLLKCFLSGLLLNSMWVFATKHMIFSFTASFFGELTGGAIGLTLLFTLPSYYFVRMFYKNKFKDH